MSKAGRGRRREIIAKVKSLLEMTTERGASEAEAMKAAEVASKLMAEHDLTYEDLDAELQAERYGVRSRHFAKSVDELHEVSILSQPVATYWDCETWFGADPDSGEVHLVFFGSADDTQLAHAMMDTLRKAMGTSWQAYKLMNSEEYAHLGQSMRKAFMAGMTDRIGTRLEDLKAARSGAGDKSRALVVAKLAIVQQRLQSYAESVGMTRETRPDTRPVVVDRDAYFAGLDAGSAVKLAEELPDGKEG
jgi:hypothetical protein